MDAHDPRVPRLEVSNRRPGGWFARSLRVLFVLGLVGIISAGATGVGAYIYYAQDLPPLENFETMETYQPTRFEAADGQLVGQWSDGKQIAVRWDQLPRELILALMAAEDKSFFFHQGLDITSILRAVYTNLMAGKIAGGGSTITAGALVLTAGGGSSHLPSASGSRARGWRTGGRRGRRRRPAAR